VPHANKNPRTPKRKARMRAEEELRRPAELAVGIGAFELDLATDDWVWTPQVAALFGLNVRNLKRSFAQWERTIFIDDVPKVRRAIEAAKQTGKYQVEFRVHHPDGTVHWLAGKGEIAPDEKENARQLRGTYYEITERKQLEARLLELNETLEARVAERTRQLEASLAQLRESERSFRLLVEAVTDYAIFMLDPVGTVVSWNPGAERIKGYAAREIIGEHFSCFYTEEDRLKGIPKAALAAASRDGQYEMEGWRVRKGGGRFWASVVIDAIRDPTGQILGFAKVTRDLTERRANEERLRQSQKMEAIGQLSGGIAHDFNNMLAVITGNIEALQRRLPDGADGNLARRLTNSALRGAERAAVLTRRLLAFARRQPLDPKPISVNALITGMSEMLRRTLGETIALETVLAGGLWLTFVDANQLENSLVNLAINARDAMPDGGRLTIEAANVYLDDKYSAPAEISPGQYVGVFVSDTGTGMAPEVVAKAFDPFFTTKKIGQGTGLGLAQVYGFVKQSGGHIRVYSELGAGTTVKLYLPRHHSTERVSEAHQAEATIEGADGETILVVEDDPDVRSFTVDMLRELGYRVVDAPDGSSGLHQLDAHHEIELLFTDVGLPGSMNGRQLADEAQRRRADLKVLFTTGYAQNAVVHHGRIDPGVELIMKPFTYAALAAKIRRVLDH
jgi:PAS domain S-box-containing protein